MTHNRSRRFRLPAILTAVVAAGVGGLVLANPLAAKASPVGGPSGPAVTYQLPGQGHDQRMRPEAFDILISSLGDNNVDAYGPVHGLAGTDTELAPFLDRWTFGGDTVNVAHQVEPAPVLDLGTCTATVTLHDGWWQFTSGTGDDQGAKGHGLFTEVALFSFPISRGGQCEFDHQGQMVYQGGSSDYGQQPYMRDHNRDLRPLFFSVEIQGKGTAKVHEAPAPYVSPSPTGSPSPTVYVTPTVSAS
jgi:hypothetical protein